MHLLMLKASGKQGVPQGGVISPLLSNIYLTEVDRMLERAKEVTRNGIYTYVEYVRFADDLVVLIDSQRNALVRVVLSNEGCAFGHLVPWRFAHHERIADLGAVLGELGFVLAGTLARRNRVVVQDRQHSVADHLNCKVAIGHLPFPFPAFGGTQS